MANAITDTVLMFVQLMRDRERDKYELLLQLLIYSDHLPCKLKSMAHTHEGYSNATQYEVSHVFGMLVNTAIISVFSIYKPHTGSGVCERELSTYINRA